jgi:hypothetical protein
MRPRPVALPIDQEKVQSLIDAIDDAELNRSERSAVHKYLCYLRRNSDDKQMTKNDTHVGFRLRRDDVLLLDEIARDRGMTVSALLRQVITRTLYQERNRDAA